MQWWRVCQACSKKNAGRRQAMYFPLFALYSALFVPYALLIDSLSAVRSLLPLPSTSTLHSPFCSHFLIPLPTSALSPHRQQPLDN